MKRFLIAMAVIVALVMASVSVTAKTPAKSGSKAKSSTSVTMKRTADGYPDVTGHTYSTKENGITFKFTLKPNNICSVTASYRGESYTEHIGWEQHQSSVLIYNSDNGSAFHLTKIGDNAKQLNGYDNEGNYFSLTLVK